MAISQNEERSKNGKLAEYSQADLQTMMAEHIENLIRENAQVAQDQVEYAKKEQEYKNSVKGLD